MTRLRRSLFIGLFIIGLGSSQSHAPVYAAFFVGLGDLPGGNVESYAHAITDDGSVVVGMSVSGTSPPGRSEAFRWTKATGLVGLGDLDGGGFHSRALGVSADGSVIVGFGNTGTTPHFEAFRWTEATGMVALGDLPGGDVWSVGLGTSADGSVVVGRSNVQGAEHAFRWTASTGMVDLGTLSNQVNSVALRTSGSGDVIVGVSRTYVADIVQYQGEAFRWTAQDGMVGLGHLPGKDFISQANGLSADGSVIVGFAAASSPLGEVFQPHEAFRWTEDQGMMSLGFLPGHTLSQAIAVSADGSVIVGASAPEFGKNEPFIWDLSHGMRSLEALLVSAGMDLTGWSLGRATGVSADGSIITGYGTNPLGQPEAWIAQVPEPSSITLLVMGLVGLAGYAWRRKRAV